MLFIPFFADQNRNAEIAIRNGNGLMLPFPQLTAETFSASMNEMLSNEAYGKRAKEIARLFDDNLVHPMEEAIFWIEYVMRSKGAAHLKSYAVNMSWFSYLLFDVFALPIAFIVIAYATLKFILKSIFKKKGISKKSEKKKRN